MDQGIIFTLVIGIIDIILGILGLTLDDEEARRIAGFFSVVASIVVVIAALCLLVYYYNNISPIVSGR